MSDKKPERREFLFTASYAVGAVGVGAVVWPLIDQMNPDASVKALASTEVDVSSVKPGNTITVQIKSQKEESFYLQPRMLLVLWVLVQLFGH